ncbi:MAG: YDG domain-containing protein, partial [Rhodoferax sp.]|uniref:YDG domain-containing protein n=1 Tax=Rhodoferax sp. TaxID=50421 RepID=UPI002632B341
ATGSFVDKNVGTSKAVALTSSYSGADAGNYSITDQASTSAIISPKALTVSATGVNKVYDGGNVATVALSDNRVAGDVLSLSDTSASFADKNVGTAKAVSVSGISVAGTDAGNYNFNTTAATSANITPKALTVSGISASNKVYDGSTAATVSTTGASYSGLVGGDAVAVRATGAFSDASVAPGKTVVLTSLYSGVDVSNYSITGQVSTTADITAGSPTQSVAALSNGTQLLPAYAGAVFTSEITVSKPAAAQTGTNPIASPMATSVARTTPPAAPVAGITDTGEMHFGPITVISGGSKLPADALLLSLAQ